MEYLLTVRPDGGSGSAGDLLTGKDAMAWHMREAKQKQSAGTVLSLADLKVFDTFAWLMTPDDAKLHVDWMKAAFSAGGSSVVGGPPAGRAKRMGLPLALLRASRRRRLLRTWWTPPWPSSRRGPRTEFCSCRAGVHDEAGECFVPCRRRVLRNVSSWQSSAYVDELETTAPPPLTPHQPTSSPFI
eukprot:3867854-Alexandrium_andersonii.AAC.1